MKHDSKCQLLIIGDSKVGKTSILRRFCQNTFNSQYLTTMGVDFFTKDVIINKKTIHVKIWDTAGQERYRAVTQNFLKKSQGLLIVYSVDDENSFNGLKFWIQSIENNISFENKDFPIIIVGNKIDIKQRIVDRIKVENLAKNKNYEYFEVSAKTGEGIDESMKYLIQKSVEFIEKDENKNNILENSIKINKNKIIKDEKSNNCCDKK